MSYWNNCCLWIQAMDPKQERVDQLPVPLPGLHSSSMSGDSSDLNTNRYELWNNLLAQTDFSFIRDTGQYNPECSEIFMFRATPKDCFQLLLHKLDHFWAQQVQGNGFSQRSRVKVLHDLDSLFWVCMDTFKVC